MLHRFSSERASIALCLLLVPMALAFSTFGRTFAELGGAFDPTFFPQIVLTPWIVFAILNLVTDLRDGEAWDLSGVGRAMLMAALILIYVVFLKALGFFASSAILLIAFLLLLGVRSIVPILAVSVGVPGTLVVLFDHVLTMPLPTSPPFGLSALSGHEVTVAADRLIRTCPVRASCGRLCRAEWRLIRLG